MNVSAKTYYHDMKSDALLLDSYYSKWFSCLIRLGFLLNTIYIVVARFSNGVLCVLCACQIFQCTHLYIYIKIYVYWDGESIPYTHNLYTSLSPLVQLLMNTLHKIYIRVCVCLCASGWRVILHEKKAPSEAWHFAHEHICVYVYMYQHVCACIWPRTRFHVYRL